MTGGGRIAGVAELASSPRQHLEDWEADHAATFCAPHHTSSMAAIVGTGTGTVRPGTASLAHLGILFLDDAQDALPTHEPSQHQERTNRDTTINVLAYSANA